MEELIAEFDLVMEKYNEEYTRAKDEESRAGVDKRYETLITEAEAILEQGLEAYIKSDQERLEEEQREAEKPLEKEDVIIAQTPIDMEVAYLYSIKPTEDFITKRYNLTNANRNGFSTREIYKAIVGVDPARKKEKTLSKEIALKINTDEKPTDSPTVHPTPVLSGRS